MAGAALLTCIAGACLMRGFAAAQTSPPQAIGMQVFQGVLTYHNDSQRTGQNLSEQILAPANINSGAFGKLFSDAADGQIYAQPLYVPNVQIPHWGLHNVVYVATEHDTVYAFYADAKLAKPLWQHDFVNPATGISTVPATDTGGALIVPEIGSPRRR
jgi:hypothetical protein